MIKELIESGKETHINMADVTAIVHYNRDDSFTIHFVGGGQLHINGDVEGAESLFEDFEKEVYYEAN